MLRRKPEVCSGLGGDMVPKAVEWCRLANISSCPRSSSYCSCYSVSLRCRQVWNERWGLCRCMGGMRNGRDGLLNGAWEELAAHFDHACGPRGLAKGQEAFAEAVLQRAEGDGGGVAEGVLDVVGDLVHHRQALHSTGALHVAMLGAPQVRQLCAISVCSVVVDRQ